MLMVLSPDDKKVLYCCKNELKGPYFLSLKNRIFNF